MSHRIRRDVVGVALLTVLLSSHHASLFAQASQSPRNSSPKGRERAWSPAEIIELQMLWHLRNLSRGEAFPARLNKRIVSAGLVPIEGSPMMMMGNAQGGSFSFGPNAVVSYPKDSDSWGGMVSIPKFEAKPGFDPVEFRNGSFRIKADSLIIDEEFEARLGGRVFRYSHGKWSERSQ